MKYNVAIMRQPANNCMDGLTSVDLGIPDVSLLKSQWERYHEVLSQLTNEVIVLDALDGFPDAYFVEDVAVVTPEIAILTNPGASARTGETEYMDETLRTFRDCRKIRAPGTLDGGDVLVVGKHCIVGLSERTNRLGAEQLCAILGEYGYRGDIVNVSEALHFKSSVNFVDEETLLVTEACKGLSCLSSYGQLVVPTDENYAANVVWFNDSVLIPQGFPKVEKILLEHGSQVIPMPVSEIAKMDGGLTCLSLRLTK